jgi:hypothetical protein
MSEGLSAYELQRLETIRKNAEVFKALGLDSAVSGMRSVPKKPKEPRAPKQPAVPTTVRTSRRLSGDVAAYDGLHDDDEAEPDIDVYRDPNDVSQMTSHELKVWCDQLREDALAAALADTLDAGQAARLRGAQEWLAPFTEFTARFGGKNETTMSRSNIKLCLKRVFQLVSGAGVTTHLRDGAFAEGRPIGLGVSREEVDSLRVEAQLWCPLKTAPEDLVGRVHHGQVVQRKPDSKVRYLRPEVCPLSLPLLHPPG